MEDINVDYGDEADRICDTIIEVLVFASEKEENYHFSRSIHRVPETLRCISKKSYTPRVVSIGPFHVEEGRLKSVQVHKRSYISHLFHRLSCPREQTMKSCVNMLLHKIVQIRACYEGMMKAIDDHELVQMMVIDGCFIVELVYRYTHNKFESPSFFDNNLLSLYVKHDLLLLENQIPFFVLQDIFSITIMKLEPRASLDRLVLSFLQDMNPFGKSLILDEDEFNVTHDHILGLLQKCYHRRLGMQYPGEKYQRVPFSVTDLALSGVQFENNADARWALAMKFKSSSRIPCFCLSRRKPTLKMPTLAIEDYTESVLRNLIAYEQLSPAIPNYVTSYAFAMETLLYTKQDLEKLIESNVIVNNFGTNEVAFDMIKGMCKEVTVKDFTYIKQWLQLVDYQDRYWTHTVTWLRRTYPWSSITIISGIILFGLTAVQTYFTVRPL